MAMDVSLVYVAGWDSIQNSNKELDDLISVYEMGSN